MSAHGLTRRAFVKGSALAAAALARPFSVHAAGTTPNERVNVAMVGVGQRMLLDLHGALRKHWNGGMMNVVALCDPNDRAGLNDKFAQKGWPILRNELAGVPRFRDYRMMFDKMGKQIDGIYLTTAHHAYFPIIITAIQRGIHAIGHKPMCVSVEEARVLSETAKKLPKVVTQTMPNRRGPYIQKLREWFDKGVLGEVREVHLCQGFGPTGGPGRGPAEPVPDTCDWDAFTCAAPPQPFKAKYLEVRGWNACAAFSCGQAGEWGTHMFVLPHTLLRLEYPTTVELVRAEGGQIVEWQFPQRGELPPVTVRAYSGKLELYDKEFPLPAGLEPERRPEGWGGWAHQTLLKGTKATVMSRAYAGGWRVVPEAKMRELLAAHGAPKSYPVVNDMWANWIEAIKAGDPKRASSGPDFYGPYLECVMLGFAACCARKVGKKLQYDPETVRITNDADADRFLRREYRKGFDAWKRA